MPTKENGRAEAAKGISITGDNSSIASACRVRIPPYGRQFVDARRSGFVPKRNYFGHLIVALDWNTASTRAQRIVLPPDSDPEQYDMRFLAGLSVTLAYRQEDAGRVPDVLAALLAANPASVLTLEVDGPAWSTHYPESGHVH